MSWPSKSQRIDVDQNLRSLNKEQLEAILQMHEDDHIDFLRVVSKGMQANLERQIEIRNELNRRID